MHKKILFTVIVAALAGTVRAEVVQDCKLEGVVKETTTKEGVKAVYIDFHSIKRYSSDNRCNLRGKGVEFDGVVGSQIQEVTPGTGVTYRYTEQAEGEKTAGEWQLLEVNI